MPMLSIERRAIAPQPIVFARFTVARRELARYIGEGMGKSYALAHARGWALAGRPFVRYPATGPGLITIEAGLPVAAAGDGEGVVQTGACARAGL